MTDRTQPTAAPPAPVPSVPAALFVDFDNVFGGLMELDPAAALSFAQRPGRWLERLAESLTVSGPRRWLVRRCYMNPDGSVPNPGGAAAKARLSFSRFRPSFTRAGFDVIDCPALTARYKNAADIRMALDAMDALAGPTRYDEFVIASGDSDLTPVLIRLRAADRRTTIMTPSDAADALTSVADRVINSRQTLELLHQRATEHETRTEPASTAPDHAVVDELPSADVELEDARARFRTLVEQLYAAAPGPLSLSQLDDEIRKSLDGQVRVTGWFGHGTLSRALTSLRLPHLQMSHFFAWDETRHEPPQSDLTATAEGILLPDEIAMVCLITDLPRLPSDVWPRVFEVFAEYAEYARTQDFNLAESTAWVRDRLAIDGLEVGRTRLAFVARGFAYGGTPLNRDPAPTAGELATTFVDTVLKRALAAQLVLTEGEQDVVRRWLGVPERSEPPSPDPT